MNGAQFGDVQQPLQLSIVQFAGQLDVEIDLIDPPGLGFAVGAVWGVNT